MSETTVTINEINKEWYIGSICRNDVGMFRSKKTSKQYFEEFCRNIREVRELQDYKEIQEIGKENDIKEMELSQNSQLMINKDGKKAIYFVSGEGWWGIQQSIVTKLKKNGYEVFILIFESKKEDFWMLKVNKKISMDGKRFMFKEDSLAKLKINEIPVKENVSPESYFASIEKISKKNIMDLYEKLR